MWLLEDFSGGSKREEQELINSNIIARLIYILGEITKEFGDPTMG
jgi:hypothetical protein